MGAKVNPDNGRATLLVPGEGRSTWPSLARSLRGALLLQKEEYGTGSQCPEALSAHAIEQWQRPRDWAMAAPTRLGNRSQRIETSKKQR